MALGVRSSTASADTGGPAPDRPGEDDESASVEGEIGFGHHLPEGMMEPPLGESKGKKKGLRHTWLGMSMR